MLRVGKDPTTPTTGEWLIKVTELAMEAKLIALVREKSLKKFI